jgi:hypothetical protein
VYFPRALILYAALCSLMRVGAARILQRFVEVLVGDL